MDQLKEFLSQNKMIVIGVLVLVFLYICYRLGKSKRESSYRMIDQNDEEQNQPYNYPPDHPDQEHFEPSSGKDRLVFFYADWCGHCKHMKPTWAQLEQKYANGPISIEKYEATEHPEMMKANGVDGFPTIKLFKRGSSEGVEYTDADRSLEALEAFMTK